MAVVGCGARMETPRNLWNCGANGEPALEPGYPSLTPCHSEVGTQYSRSSFYSSPRIFEDNTTTTLYLWSRGGEAVTLPPDTGMIFVKYSFFVKLVTNITLLLDSGFPVGGPSTIQYLVLQVGLQLLVVLHQIINGQNKSYQWPLALKFNSPGAILTLSLKYGFENCICLGRFNNT